MDGLPMQGIEAGTIGTIAKAAVEAVAMEAGDMLNSVKSVRGS